jgi:hypothetical protein
MTDTGKMKCPDCGADMNHHAEKVDYSVEPGNEDFGGALQEVHCCPGCGNTVMRIASRDM